MNTGIRKKYARWTNRSKEEIETDAAMASRNVLGFVVFTMVLASALLLLEA